MKIPIVIPIYKPDPKVYGRVREMLKKQTVKNEVLEISGFTESKGMNHGIKKATGEIIVTMNQDCIPEDEYWLEKLIKPFEDSKVVATVSDTIVMPYELWKKADIISKALTIKEQKIVRSALDARGCAYRRKILMDVGLFNEDPNIGGIDDDIYLKMKSKGKIAYPGCVISHWHPYTGAQRLNLEYKYAIGSGAVTKLIGSKLPYSWKGVFKAIPLIGLLGIWFVFPVKRAPLLFLFYLLISPAIHLIYITGFWKGYFRIKRA